MRRFVIWSAVSALGMGLSFGCARTEPVVVVAPPPAGPVVPGPVDAFGDGVGMPAAVARGALATEGALRQHTHLADGADAHVSVDPSGKWIVFTSTRHSLRPKVYLQKVDGVTVTQLTTDDADDASPAFSPDGKKIAFASNRSGRWSLYTMDLDGKNVVQLTGQNTTGGQDLHPSWSADGNWIAYSSLGIRSGVWELWILDVNTSARKMVGEGLFPAWSPDKTVSRLAFQKARQRGGRQFSIWTLDLDNGEPRRLTEVAWSASAALVTPAWSPDGAQLAFASVTPQPNAAPSHDLWVIDADGTNRRRLTDGVGVALSPTFGAGRVFYVSDRAGTETVWSVAPAALAGTPATPPTTPTATNDTKEATSP